ncbi:hypothetical protein HN51_070499 [Arachis hypogaea]
MVGMFHRYLNYLKSPSFSPLTLQAPRQTETTLQLPVFSSFQHSPCHISRSHASCVYLIQSSSLHIHSFGKHVVPMRNYCSKTVSVIQNSSFSVNVEEVNGLESYVDKVYNSVMDSSLGFNNLENALDQLGVPLSTPLVTGVLYRLRYDEKIAFRFFTWAGCQQNYSHEPCAYNDMMDILSCTKYKTKQFRIVCDMLEYMKRHNKNTVPVEVLLTILRRYTEKYLTRVQKFAKKKRIRVKTQPEINAFNLLLDALCKCCLVEDAEGLYKKVRKRIKANADTHNILVFGWCRVRNPTRAMKFLEEMIELGHKPDNFTYNTALDTFFKAGMITEALNLFEFMRTKDSTISSPTAKTYAIVIVALVQNDRMEECFELTGHMISNGCLPDVSTYKDIIEGMCLNGKIDEAYKFLDEMGNKGYPPDIVTYNCFLKVLCDNKKSEEALKLYGRMIEFGCLPSVQTYNMLISMFFDMDDPDGAFETWHEMEERGCRPDTHTYCVMVEGLFRCNRIDDAFILLEEVINKGIKLPYRKFDSFLMQLSTIGDLHAIHRLSDHMRKFYNHAMARRYALSQKRKSMSLRGNDIGTVYLCLVRLAESTSLNLTQLALLHHIYLLCFEPCSSCLSLKEDTFRWKPDSYPSGGKLRQLISFFNISFLYVKSLDMVDEEDCYAEILKNAIIIIELEFRLISPKDDWCESFIISWFTHGSLVNKAQSCKNAHLCQAGVAKMLSWKRNKKYQLREDTECSRSMLLLEECLAKEREDGGKWKIEWFGRRGEEGEASEGCQEAYIHLLALVIEASNAEEMDEEHFCTYSELQRRNRFDLLTYYSRYSHITSDWKYLQQKCFAGKPGFKHDAIPL